MSEARTLLSAEVVKQRAALLSGWTAVDCERLTKTFRFPDFQKGLDFVNQVGAIAEKQGHHPDIQLSWGKVEVATWTHDAGGITEQDFRLATQIEGL